MPSPLRLVLLALLLTPLTLAGCDAIEDAVGLNDIDVPLGSTGSVEVAADSTTRSSGDVDIDQDIPGSPDVDGITVLEENVSFVPAALRGGSAQAATFNFWVLVDDVPALSGSVAIGDDNEVTDVSTRYTAAYTVEQICSAYAAGCPVSSVLSESAIRSHVNSALNSGSFSIDLILQNESDVAGTLVISELLFDLGL